MTTQSTTQKPSFGTIYFPTASAYEQEMKRASTALPCLTSGQFSTIVQQNPLGDERLGTKDRPLRALHVALEFEGAEVGGIAAVTKTLLPQQIAYATSSGKNDRHIDARIVTPGYKHLFDKYPASARKELGSIPHYYDAKMVESKIYRVKTSGIRHYLIEPDPRLERIFDVGQAKDIYKHFDYSSSQDRVNYFTSACSAFIAYKRKPLDIVHLHAWHTGFTAPLLKQVYRQKMLEEGKDTPAIVSVFHVLGMDQGASQDGTLANKAGLIRAQGINQAAEYMMNADRILTVSKAMLQDALKEKTDSDLMNLQPLFEGANDLDKVEGISNGITIQKHDPKNKEVYGRMALPQSQETVDLTMQEGETVAQWKTRLKSHLVHWGIIKDASLPLFVFCARASSVKGVEMLPHIKKQLEGKASLLILCVKTEDQAAGAIIDRLASQKNPKTNFNVLASIDEQKPIKAALFGGADFFLSTSHDEPDGVSLKEFLATGSIAISSRVGGTRDTVDEIFSHPAKSGHGNGIFYDDSHSTKQLQEAIKKILGYWNSLTSFERETLQRNILNQSRKNFDWIESGKLERYFTAYLKARRENRLQLSEHVGEKI